MGDICSNNISADTVIIVININSLLDNFVFGI